MPTPHNNFIKKILEQPAQAASELASVLPPNISARIDWSTVSIERGHFVSEAQRELRSDRPWSRAQSFGELLDLDGDLAEALRPYLPHFRFLLDDLSAIDERALWDRPLTEMLCLALLLLKRARTSQNLMADLQRWKSIFVRVVKTPNGLEVVVAMLNYAIEVGDIEPEEVRRLAHSLGPAVEEEFMTGAQKLIQQGHNEGRQEGQTQLLLRLLRLKFGDVSSEAEAQIKAASAEQLDIFAERVLTASSIDEVLTGPR